MSMWLDSTSAALAAYKEQLGPGLQRDLTNAVVRIRRDVLKLLPHLQPIPQEVSGRYLQKLMKAVEVRIECLCRPHSWYLLLFLSRRLGVEKLKYSLETHAIGKHVLTLACHKYGHRDIEKDFRHVPSGEHRFLGVSQPRILADEHFRAVYELRELAIEHALNAGILRSIWKGGRLIVHEDWNFEVLPDREEIRKLTALYDNRQGWAGFSGIAATSVAVTMATRTSFPALAAIPNFNQKALSANLELGGAESDFAGRVPNYLPKLVSLNRTYAVLSDLYNAEPTRFEECLRLTPKQLIAFLVAICEKELEFLANDARACWQLSQTGYVPFVVAPDSSDLSLWYRDAHSKCFGETPDIEEALEVINLFLQKITYQDQDFTETMLWDRSPFRIGFYVGEQLFWDFTATVATLDSLLYPLAKLPGGSIGGRKGHAFERNLADELGQAGFDPWRVSYTVRTTSRKKDDGEIDVSVIHDNVLFIIECKSNVLTQAYDRGEREAVESRALSWKKVVERHIQFCKRIVARNPGKLGIPKNVEHIVAFCCSPFKEFYPTSVRSQDFLGANIPIVATPIEVVEFVRIFSLKEHIGKPYLIDVDWSTGK